MKDDEHLRRVGRTELIFIALAVLTIFGLGQLLKVIAG